jgi:hypothetical protein
LLEIPKEIFLSNFVVTIVQALLMGNLIKTGKEQKNLKIKRRIKIIRGQSKRN